MNLKNQTNFYKGKVRDVYTINDKFLLMIASNRLSAFDVILPREIPYKGQVLNQLSKYFFDRTNDICENWLIDTPFPNCSIGYKCEPYKIEFVVRGYLCGSAWRRYKAGQRSICGIELPDGLNENDRLDKPIITPTTKSEQGHDKDITRDEIIANGIIPENELLQIENLCLKLFIRGTELVKDKGFLLVDTKFEFGKLNDSIILIDEIFTPDSSRYFFSHTYEENQKHVIKHIQVSKEFIRIWLMENGFNGFENQTIPLISESFAQEISHKYIRFYEYLTGEIFVEENFQIDFVKINDIIQKLQK
jgi:phosphoribosylaminoimidazole-succinocarboxamide synthase